MAWARAALLGLALAGAIPAAWAGLDSVLPMPASPAYVEECGACHAAYAPTYLPARSWRALMAGLDRHFGTDASLDSETRERLLGELVGLASDSGRADRFLAPYLARIAPGETPLRVSETPFFRFMHDEVPGHIWRRASVAGPANCGACHPRADQGRYFEREVKIPK